MSTLLGSEASPFVCGAKLKKSSDQFAYYQEMEEISDLTDFDYELSSDASGSASYRDHVAECTLLTATTGVTMLSKRSDDSADHEICLSHTLMFASVATDVADENSDLDEDGDDEDEGNEVFPSDSNSCYSPVMEVDVGKTPREKDSINGLLCLIKSGNQQQSQMDETSATEDMTESEDESSNWNDSGNLLSHAEDTSVCINNEVKLQGSKETLLPMTVSFDSKVHLQSLGLEMEESQSVYSCSEHASENFLAKVLPCTSQSKQKNNFNKCVRFSVVRVREYAITLGDHPMVDQYPITLDWTYEDKEEVELEVHLSSRLKRGENLYSCNDTSELSLADWIEPLPAYERKAWLAAVTGLTETELFIQDFYRRRRVDAEKAREEEVREIKLRKLGGSTMNTCDGRNDKQLCSILQQKLFDVISYITGAL